MASSQHKDYGMKTFLVTALLLLAVPAFAGPKLALSTPDQVAVGTMSYKISKLEFHFGSEPMVIVVLIGENGEVKRFSYSEDIAAAMLASPMLTSLRAKALRRVVADGALAGTVLE